MMTNADIVLRAVKGGIKDDSNMRSILRISRGSKQAAMALIKDVAKHYINDEALLDNISDFEWAFDTAYAELFGGGCEIEWPKD